MYWMIYRKGMHSSIGKVWYPLHTAAEEVHAEVSEEFDFDVLVSPDSED